MMTKQDVILSTVNADREKSIKRSKSEIILNILTVCAKGATKTKIVYQANLNFKTVTPYIDLLSEKGLLNSKQGSSIIYETTPQGIEVMKTLRQLSHELL
jgi:predicted transcriptional regulator